MIRPFEPEDWPEFIRLVRNLHEEADIRDLPLSDRYMLNSIKREGLFHELAWQEDEAVGICMGWVEETFFGPAKVGHQHMFYVAPHARGGLLARTMLHRFERWCIEQGAEEVWVSQATGINVERTEEFFHALGFQPVGFIARKAV